MKIIVSTIMAASLSLTAFALNPSRTYKQKPDNYRMTYESLKVETNDGNATLNIWCFPSNKGKQCILMAHNGEGNMGDYLRRVDQFVTMGYNVVTFDYRGYGESSEFEIDNNMYIYPHFLNDMETMIDFCRKKYQSTFDIYGWGIGAGLALGVGWSRPEARKIIADTPFLSMEDLEERFGEWDQPMEVPFAGYDKKFEPIYSVTNTPGKNLKGVKLIIGNNDVLFSVDDMNRIQGKSSGIVDSDVYVVENPDRKDNFRVDKSAYFRIIKSFLKN